MPTTLTDLAPALDDLPGTVSVWFGGLDGKPRFVRHEHATHYAASTMKVAVMAAAYRLAEDGELDLDAEVPVHDDFASQDPSSRRFSNERSYDNDPEPWERLGGTASLRWLIRRMIIMSSNLATNLVIEQLGRVDVIAEVWKLAGAEHSVTARGIEDYAAQKAGLTNLITAADLSRLMIAAYRNQLASPESSAEMMAVLLAQEADEYLHAGLPARTRAASKSGWVDDIRHTTAIVLPDDAPEFALSICISSPADKETASATLTKITAAAWADRLR